MQFHVAGAESNPEGQCKADGKVDHAYESDPVPQHSIVMDPTCQLSTVSAYPKLADENAICLMSSGLPSA